MRDLMHKPRMPRACAPRRAESWVCLAGMVLGLSAFSSTFGLVVIFFVVFPVLVQGLITLAVAQSLGERAENQDYAAGLRTGDDEAV